MLCLLVLFPWPAFGQIPDAGDFHYILFDNRDRPVGTYSFTIQKDGILWRIASQMNIDTTFLLFRVRFMDHNSFTHDGKLFHSFYVDYLKDIPLQSTLRQEVRGVRDGNIWRIQATKNGKSSSSTLPSQSFEEVRNLISRLIRPESVLLPGQLRKTVSLDPLTLEISEVESRGVQEESVEFQGRVRKLFVIEQKASDGDVTVKKFANGLIYRSQTSDGYALLKSAHTASF